ncbi:MAG: DUF4135 domain-containing protein [Flammeovirgaceae bacterium]
MVQLEQDNVVHREHVHKHPQIASAFSEIERALAKISPSSCFYDRNSLLETLKPDFERIFQFYFNQGILLVDALSKLDAHAELEHIQVPVTSFTKYINRVVTHINKAVATFEENIQRINDTLCLALSTSRQAILSISLLGFETHNGGKQPLKFELSHGQSIVFKYTPLYSEDLFSTIIEHCWQSEHKPNTLQVVCIDENCGFSKYIETNTTFASAVEIPKFYVNTGELLAIAYALNISDMHMENIIKQAHLPILLDLESLFYQFPKKMGKPTVFATQMLQPKAIDFYSSGIQGGGKTKHYFPTINKRKSDLYGNMNFRNEGYHTANRIFNHQEMINPSLYQDEIIAGFSQGYLNLKPNRQKVIEIIQNYEHLNKLRIRHILRHTVYYVNHLFHLNKPFIDIATNQLSRLNLDESDAAPLSEPIIAMEKSQLLEGDVPYFYTKMNDRHLYAENRIIVENYFNNDSFHEVKSKLDQLSQDDMRYQIDLIRKSLNG